MAKLMGEPQPALRGAQRAIAQCNGPSSALMRAAWFLSRSAIGRLGSTPDLYF